MRVLMVMVLLLASASCFNRKPVVLDIGLYEQGSSVFGLKTAQGEKTEAGPCVVLAPGLSELQTVYTVNNHPAYLVNLKDFINLSGKARICSSAGIKLTNMKLKYYTGRKGYFTLPYAYYEGSAEIGASFQCKGRVVHIDSVQTHVIRRDKNFKGKHHKSLALVIVFLAFDKALSDIVDKYQKAIKDNCH